MREYLDELYRPAVVKNGKKFPGPWQTCPKRMLRHKCQIQGIRIAYGLSGLFEPDEAERILETQMGEPVPDLRELDLKPAEAASVAEKMEAKPVPPEPDALDDAVAELEAELLAERQVAVDEIPERKDIDPSVLAFIDQVVDRARGTGAFTAAQGFAQERFKDDGNALNYCLFRLDEAQAASAARAPAA